MSPPVFSSLMSAECIESLNTSTVLKGLKKLLNTPAVLYNNNSIYLSYLFDDIFLALSHFLVIASATPPSKKIRNKLIVITIASALVSSKYCSLKLFVKISEMYISGI